MTLLVVKDFPDLEKLKKFKDFHGPVIIL